MPDINQNIGKEIGYLAESLASLQERDRKILEYLQLSPISSPVLASNLLVLPSELDESIERLGKAGLVDTVEPSSSKWKNVGEYAINLSPRGMDAQRLLPLFGKSGSGTGIE